MTNINDNAEKIYVRKKKVPTLANIVSIIFFVLTLQGSLVVFLALGNMYPIFSDIVDSTPIFSIIYIFAFLILYGIFLEKYKNTNENFYKKLSQLVFCLTSLIAYWGLSGAIIFETLKAFFFENNSSIAFVPAAFKTYLAYIAVSLVGSLITYIILKTDSLFKFKTKKLYYTEEELIREEARKKLEQKKWEEEEWEICEEERAKREGRKYYRTHF